ncbi:MFS-type transporter SLC18B1-like [Sycon ciliatum]|uniref:MFS-type transporter SLC18B1-like n=1 Tax=Sycon ciliatum TaxID=27933 RepID=UPI0020AB6A91|eukprot:scpid60873/ scgid19919/ MFS-type transporter SLC18B1; Solute carrier family 18 member B1
MTDEASAPDTRNLLCDDGEEDLFSGKDDCASSLSYTRKRRNIVFACIGVNSVLIAASVSLMMPVLSIEAQFKNPSDAPAKHASVGIVFSVAKFSEFIAAPLLASEMQNVGSKYLLVLSALGVGGCLTLFAFVDYVSGWPQFLMLSCAVRIVQGVFTVGNFIAVYAILVAVLPDRLAFANGSIRAFNGFGYAFGPFLGGVLYDAGGFVVAFVIGGVLVSVMAMLMIIFLPSVDTRESQKVLLLEAKSKNQISTWRILAVPWIWVGLTTMFLGNFMIGAVEATLPLHLDRVLLTTTSVGGTMFLMFGLIYGGLAPILGYTVDRGLVSMKVMQIMGLLVTAIAFQLIGPVGYVHTRDSLGLTAFSMTLFAIGIAPMITLSPIDITRTLSERGFGTAMELRYAVAGTTRAALSLGYAAGPIVANAISAGWTFENGMAIIGAAYFLHGLLLITDRVFRYAVGNCRNTCAAAAAPSRSE